MFLSRLRRSAQNRAKATSRRPIRLQLEHLEEREVLSGADVSPPNFYNGPMLPLPQVADQLSALSEAYQLTAYLPWDGPQALQSAGQQFGAGQDAAALQFQGSANGQAATAWNDITQARSLLNQEVDLYNQQPQLGWADPDTYNGGHGTAQENQLASQAEQLLWNAYNIISALPTQTPPNTGSGTNSTTVLQGHVEVNVPGQGPMNWWQAAQNALSQVMDDLNQQLTALADSVNQWQADFYDSGLKAFITFGQGLDQRVDALGAYLTSNAAANQAAQFNAVGKWFTNNAVDNQVQAVQAVENDIQHFQENPADASAGLVFNLGTGAVLGGASGALDGILFSGGATALEGTATANAMQTLQGEASAVKALGGPSNEVILDTNAAIRFAEAQQLLGTNEVPVITRQVMNELQDLVARGDLQGIPNVVQNLRVIEDATDFYVQGQLRNSLGAWYLPRNISLATGPIVDLNTIRGLSGDAIIGTTGLLTERAIITADAEFYNALSKVAGNLFGSSDAIRFLAPPGL